MQEAAEGDRIQDENIASNEQETALTGSVEDANLGPQACSMVSKEHLRHLKDLAGHPTKSGTKNNLGQQPPMNVQRKPTKKSTLVLNSLKSGYWPQSQFARDPFWNLQVLYKTDVSFSSV